MSSPITIRRAVADDSYTLARLRTAMWNEMHPDELPDDSFRERSFVYWYERLEDQAAYAWLAELDRTPIGMAGLLIHHHPPLPHIERKRGYVTGVYVAPEYRYQGLGRRLMDTVIAWSRELKLKRLELRTSPQGRALYAGLGFDAREVLMLDL